ncbi:permease [Chrysiogenes arsenatis]|uniref:permease n=1 Tax=Chrysiogenes arsenatis TaxID=309797 RepID=UPI0004185295|nr:permease [Chrysiogenes arsenatis]
MWQALVDRIMYEWLALSPESQLNQAANFFIYDVIKIWFLLISIIFVVTFARSYVDANRVRTWLQGKSEFVGNILAACFGIITPFCSCSAIPLFLGFLQARIPLGVTFSFLISAPLNNEVAIALLLGLFGWKVAGLYVALGLTVAILGGFVIGRLKMERYVIINVEPMEGELDPGEIEKRPLGERASEAWQGTVEIFRKVYLYVMLGVGVGAFIHGYIPADLIANWAGPGNPFAVPIAVLLGVPMYSNAAGVLPLISVLTAKGMQIGSALAFMMAVTALSLPEAIILKQILHARLIALFFGIVSIGIVVVGYVFNFFLS